MIPFLYVHPEAIALDPELPPLPLWLTLSLAGVATLVTALALTLG